MKGLFKNNYYTALLIVKTFLIIMLLSGAFVVIFDTKPPALLISNYMLLGMIGFPFLSIASLQKECDGNWGIYKLTTPVKRADIVKSHFLSLPLWLFAGIAISGISAALFTALHGYPFSKNTDIFMLFVAGVVISLSMGAIFFLLFYFGSEERTDVYLIISLLCGIGIVAFLTSLLPSSLDTMQTIVYGILILAFTLLTYTLSYLLAIHIYYKKECP